MNENTRVKKNNPVKMKNFWKAYIGKDENIKSGSDKGKCKELWGESGASLLEFQYVSNAMASLIFMALRELNCDTGG